MINFDIDFEKRFKSLVTLFNSHVKNRSLCIERIKDWPSLKGQLHRVKSFDNSIIDVCSDIHRLMDKEVVTLILEIEKLEEDNKMEDFL